MHSHGAVRLSAYNIVWHYEKTGQKTGLPEQNARVGDLDLDDLVVEAHPFPVQLVPLAIHRDAGAAALHLQALPAQTWHRRMMVMVMAFLFEQQPAGSCAAVRAPSCAAGRASAAKCGGACGRCAAALHSSRSGNRIPGAALPVCRPAAQCRQQGVAHDAVTALDIKRTRSGRAAPSGRAQRQCPAPVRAHRPTCGGAGGNVTTESHGVQQRWRSSLHAAVLQSGVNMQRGR